MPDAIDFKIGKVASDAPLLAADQP